MLKTPDVYWPKSKRISCQLTLTSDMTFRRHDAQHRHPNWNEYSRKKKNTLVCNTCTIYTVVSQQLFIIIIET